MNNGPQDAQLQLQDAVTKTASFNSAALDLGEGYGPDEPGQPVVGEIAVTAIDTGNGDETYSFVLQQSADGATNWTAIGAAVAVTAVGVALAKGFVTKEFVRLSLTAGGTTPSITYSAGLNPMEV